MKRRTPQERRELEQESLGRARSFSMANFVPVIQEFTGRGIPMAEILPKENVFTYHAWRALGRQVRRGEHGVKVTTFVPMKGREALPHSETGCVGECGAGCEQTGDKITKGGTRLRPTTAVVFHVSQTDPIAERGAVLCHDDAGYLAGGNYASA